MGSRCQPRGSNPRTPLPVRFPSLLHEGSGRVCAGGEGPASQANGLRPGLWLSGGAQAPLLPLLAAVPRCLAFAGVSMCRRGLGRPFSAAPAPSASAAGLSPCALPGRTDFRKRNDCVMSKFIEEGVEVAGADPRSVGDS